MQIEHGFRMGRDEIVKITKRYFLKTPCFLLVLTNRKRGPPFLCAVLSVLCKHSDRVPDNVALINDVGDQWGRYIYESNHERNEDEKLWYDLLTQNDKSINDLIHIWPQFFLNWPILTEELQRLINTTPTDDVPEGGISPLNVFAMHYRRLFEYLYAVFGPMMSNSRLAEQVHGMMRHGLQSSIGMDQADHQRQFTTNIDYGLRESR